MCIRRASRGRLERPLSCNEVSGTWGFCEDAAAVDCEVCVACCEAVCVCDCDCDWVGGVLVLAVPLTCDDSPFRSAML